MLSLIPACLLASSVDCFGVFANSSLLIGFFGWPLWGFRWFRLAYWAILGDCFGAFADFSLPIGFFRLTALTFSLILACLSCFFGWLLWGLFLFQLAYRSSLVDCFSAFADSSLPIGLLWLTALALSLISVCFLASLVDCFGDFFYFSLLIGLFGWLLWRFRWFQLAYQLLWLTALGLSLIPACLLASFRQYAMTPTL